ncbi:probable UDP-3-O-acylglucosamine N-acyltransferase 2, mitochondrial isoform X1 [Impatiens glandulifera]|uniref:probable UDP-3-O-acylglucosamine N-acyltransferase 2, mitochondrial isoform X1 n=2 Tax=Impatiens glandulifera TaxID=253017 RepID=UPI001FB17874|nr:probable UDP-3-O-acylglucosamine N-acyltransferase 2, mitochondrial isoform X1 [Impatiens glandulifera]
MTLRKLLLSANIGKSEQTFRLIFSNLPIAEVSHFSSGSPTSISTSYRNFSHFADDSVISKRLEDNCRNGYQEFMHWKNGGGTFHRSASIAETAVIEYGAIIHPEAVIGENAHIASGTIIGPAVTVGRSTKTGYNVVLSNCVIGDSCVIHNGVCIGQDGFGFFLDEHGEMVKKPQMLKAMVGNHVEIGANSCIDRGSWRDTAIGDHTKIDNLVQIGHNVIIGKYCMLCGQVGIAGSAMIGDYVTFGGRVAVRDHVSIVSKVRLAANSCVTKNISEEGDYGGFPAVPIKEWRRQVARQRQLGSSHHQNKN